MILIKILLVKWNDDVTYYTLFMVCTAVCETSVLSRRHVLCVGNSLAFQNQKSDIVAYWYNGQGIQPAFYRYNSNFLKYKRSFFTWYHAPLMLLWSTSFEFYVDTNTASDVTVPLQLSTLKLIFCCIKIILATGELINIDKLTFHEAN